MDNSFTVKQGVMTAQALLKGMGHPIAVDGAWGPASKRAFNSIPQTDRNRVKDVVHVVNKESSALVAASQTVTPKTDFDLVVDALIAQANKRKLPNPLFYVAQIALETGWGNHVPKSATGSKSWNYAGLKSNSVKGMASTGPLVSTKEFENGKMISVNDSFAVFTGPKHFAEVYFWYLFDGPSSYRYKGVEKARTALEFGQILRQNGYATDPAYPAKIAAVVSSAERRYA